MRAHWILLTLIQSTFCSSVFVDWSSDVPNGAIKAFAVDYSPPVGYPSAGTQVGGNVQQMVVNQTMPATDYTFYVTAIMSDNSRRNISERQIPSSPEAPILDTIETTSSDATIAFFAPDGKDISFYIEYFPIDREEYANFVETKSTLVKIRGLDPGTEFRLRILSVFRGVPSPTSIDTTFSTKDTTGSEEMSFSVKTLPPNFNLATTPIGSTEYEYGSKESKEEVKEETTMTTTMSPPMTMEVTADYKSAETSEPEYYYSHEENSVTGKPAITSQHTQQQNIYTAPTAIFTTDTTTPMTFTMTTMPPTLLTTPPTTVLLPIVTETVTTTATTPTTTSMTMSESREPTYSTEMSSDEYDMTKKINMAVTRRTTQSTTTTEATTTITTTATAAPTTRLTTLEVTTTPKTTTAEGTTAPPTIRTTRRIITESIPDEEEEAPEVDSEIGEVDFTVDVATKSSLFEEYGEPAPIYLSKEGKMLRLEWEVSEGALCDAFMLNYTVLTLSKPKTFTIATQEMYALIKMFTDHKLELKVHCMLAGALSKTWWAYRIADLSKPKAIENLQVKSIDTNEFYVSSIVLDWDWPVFHDFNYYKILVSYSYGKNTVGANELEVTKSGPVLLEKLEATQLYTISVRNISIELDISSVAKGVKQTTPPIISSTVYPGEISSTKININFGPSDPEQGMFTHYELEFTGNNKNISKKIGMDGERSFTFTKLIPGKTYHFALFTVFQGIRSRPVETDITTYPLKVEKLHPVVGKDYAVLYWDIENFADNDVRFRLSYVGTSNTGFQSTSTVELKRKSHYRFNELNLDTYYTFTIIVIMGLGDAEAESESEMVTVTLGKEVRSIPTLQRHGTRELALTFENDHNMWHELNGNINNFAVIVTEDLELGGDDYELHSWFEVKNDDAWSAYRASRSNYNPFQKRTVKKSTFIIGEDDCEQQQLDEPFCNGMLRANTNYLAKIRAYTDEGIAIETGWVSIAGAIDEETDAEKEEKGLPCHMFLNGCPGKGSEKKGFFASLMSALGFGIVFLL